MGILLRDKCEPEKKEDKLSSGATLSVPPISVIRESFTIPRLTTPSVDVATSGYINRNTSTAFWTLSGSWNYSTERYINNRWTGNYNSYWSNISNWSLNHVPRYNENVIIDGDGICNMDIDVNAHDITITDNSNIRLIAGNNISITANSLTLGGNATCDLSNSIITLASAFNGNFPIRERSIRIDLPIDTYDEDY